jgi:hypothetical protein
MPDQITIEHARAVTKILADLDISFSVSRTPEGVPIWDLVPFLNEPPTEGQTSNADPGLEPIRVALILREAFLHVFHLYELKDELKPEKAVELLKLNVRMVIAKVGIEARLGAPGWLLWIGSHLPQSEITAESVKIHIGAVLGGARQTRTMIAQKLDS